ncbi:serine hydrolase [Leptolyngbya sp. 15MV]|nr:serine hydrolase [Leptolyngbya sp. 15MV]
MADFRRIFGIGAAIAAMALAQATPAKADRADFEAAFDRTLGTEARAPQNFDAIYTTGFEAHLARIANGAQGRIGVAAVDLTTGRSLAVLGDQRFPMASTSKIAVAAAFLEGVEQGKWSLTSEFPLLVPVSSPRFSSRVAPVRQGNHLPATELIELMITRSSAGISAVQCTAPAGSR